jgi:leucyl aminopeptidase
VIGFLKGTDHYGVWSGETVIFGAHYDSANWIDDNSAWKSGAAPGADDDASGIAALLEIGKVISQAHKRNELRRSVVLVAFQAEEVGLWGSKAFVDKLLKKGTFGKPVASVIADMVSFSGREEVARQAIFSTTKNDPANLALLDTLAHQAKADGSLKGFEVDYTGCCSDHEPFLKAGYPAALLIERDNDYFGVQYGHSTKDVLRNTDASFGAAMTRLSARVVLAYAAPV